MSHWEAVKRITAWEFKRFLRLRELLTTVIVVAALGAGVPLIIEYMSTRGASDTITLAVPVGADLPPVGRFEFVAMSTEASAEALAAGDVDGVLDLSDLEAPRVTVEREPRWSNELSEVLSVIAMADRAAAAGLETDELEALLQPVALEVEVPANA